MLAGKIGILRSMANREFEAMRNRNRRTGQFEDVPSSGQPSAAPAHNFDLTRVPTGETSVSALSLDLDTKWDESHADHDKYGWSCSECAGRFCQECSPPGDGAEFCHGCCTKKQAMSDLNDLDTKWTEAHADHDEYGWRCDWCDERFCQECSPGAVDSEFKCHGCAELQDA